MFYLTTHSTHFIYGYMASDIWLRTIQIAREETRCRHIGYSFRLTARVLLYAPSHRQDITYHSLFYTRRGALAGNIVQHYNCIIIHDLFRISYHFHIELQLVNCSLSQSVGKRRLTVGLFQGSRNFLPQVGRFRSDILGHVSLS